MRLPIDSAVSDSPEVLKSACSAGWVMRLLIDCAVSESPKVRKTEWRTDRYLRLQKKHRIEKT